MVDPVDEERRTIGDVGLLNAFLKIVPAHNVVHLSDDESQKITSTKAKDQLERLLQRIPDRKEPCQVVFYYGGHGKPRGFCMDDGLFRYRDIVELMETYLRKGDSAWFLVDCCYSGNFCTFLQQQEAETGHELKGSYCCIMSTTHDEEAGGDEWCLPGAFVSVMEGNVPSKDNTNKHVDGNGMTVHATIAEAISFMADRHALVKMDRMTAFISGPSISPHDSFPFAISASSDSTESPGKSLAKSIKKFLRGSSKSNESSLLPQIEPFDLNGGDMVFAKWRGGRPTNDSEVYLLPTWYRATVLNAIGENNVVRVQFEHPTPPITWEYDVDMNDITHELNFNYRYFNDTPSGIQRNQRRMAKCGKYVDYSVACSTRVYGLWADEDVLYEAIVISDRDIQWKGINKNHFEKRYSGIVGPYVLVEWIDDEEWTIVPLCHLFIPKDSLDTVPTATELRARAKIMTEQESILSRSPMECLLQSFHSAGKTLVPAESFPSSAHLSCFWAEDSEWYDAKPEKLHDDELNVLSSHLCYKERGAYCIVRWDEDGSKSCLPMKFVRRKR